MDTGQLRKYLFYALGEVILIVIGIFIAIQLNTLNESRKLDRKRSDLMDRLSKQIEINQYQTKDAIKELQRQTDDISKMMSYIGTPKVAINDLTIDSLMASVIEDHHLGLDITTLQEALDNGEISNLNDEGLRTALYSFLKANEQLEQREDIANFDNNNFMIPFLYKNTNSRNTSANVDEDYRKSIGNSRLKPSDYKALLSNRQFENLV